MHFLLKISFFNLNIIIFYKLFLKKTKGCCWNKRVHWILPLGLPPLGLTFWINVVNKMFISRDITFRSVLQSLASNLDMFYTDSNVPNIMNMLLILFLMLPGSPEILHEIWAVLACILFLFLLYSRWYDPIPLFRHIWTVCD